MDIYGIFLICVFVFVFTLALFILGNYKLNARPKPIESESFLIYVSFADHTSSFGGATVTLRKQITSYEDIKSLQAVLKDQFKLEYIPVIVSWREM